MIHPVPDFIVNLKHALTLPLPGIHAHKEMVPVGRLAYEQLQNKIDEYRQGAVLVHLCFDDNEWKIIFIQRSTYDGVHSAQMAFPGGKYDDSDGTFQNTAMREAYEEVQLHAHQINFIGALSVLHIPVSRFTVYPFVSWQHGMPNLVADVNEVTSIHILPLANFYDDRNRIETEVTLQQGVKKNVQAFNIQNNIIWGATAMIMHEFVTIAKGFKSLMV